MPLGFVMSEPQIVVLPSVIASLEAVRDRVKQRLTKVPEYRAFLAIEKPIAEVADISDLVADLQVAKQKILDRLTTTREYQALLTVEKAIKDFSEILDLVDNDTDFDAASAALKTAVEKEEEVSPVKPAAVAEAQQPAPPILTTARLGNPLAGISTEMTAPSEMPEIYSREAIELAAPEAAGDRTETSISNSAQRRSSLGLVEEWRLTSLVHESFSANLGKQEAQSADEDQAQAEKTRVA
jgi:hypothetical protein